jgi:predicted  nucleic acid-binding Zn-ribbon protein
MSVPPQTIIEVRRALQIIRCSCGRLLYVKD